MYKIFNYDYIIYKLYYWAIKKNGETPVLNVIGTLAVVHFFQLLLLLFLIRFLFTIDLLKVFFSSPKYLFVVFFLFWILIHFLIFYNKEKWENLLKKYSGENEQEKKKGTVFVLIYLIGSIFIFFAALPLISM